MKKAQKNLIVLAITAVAAFALGVACTYRLTANTTYTPGIVQTNVAEVKVKNFSNPCSIGFVLTDPIAPDYYVGTGSIGSGYSIYADDPDWDPLGIGTDDVMTLIDRIRQEVPGITEDVYACGYELDVIIAESYLSCRDDIIENVLAIIEEECG